MGWKMFPSLDRVYDNKKAREHLGWKPKYNFSEVLESVASGGSVLRPMEVS